MSADKTSPSDINALAAEVMDLWQEHLAVYAADPKAKAELMRMLEPQRQLFADWTAMMQNGVHGAGTETSAGQSTGRATGRATASASAPVASKSPGAATAAHASDDGALRLAQLAHRLALFEGRVAELEKRMALFESKPKSNAGAAKATRRSKSH